MKLVVALTGGGASWLHEYTKHGGASKTLLEFSFPYGAKALENYAGPLREKSVSSSTARQMALASYLRGIEMGEDPDELMGIGGTFALTTENQREDRLNQGYVAIQTARNLRVGLIDFKNSGVFSRKSQEYLASDFVKREMKLAENPALCIYEDLKELLRKSYSKQGHPPKDLIWNPDKVSLTESQIFAGSFNPIHEGHIKMAQTVEKLTGEDVIFEIGVYNFSKAPLDFIEILKRYELIKEAGFKCIVNCNRHRTFEEKSEYYKNCAFVVGGDTWNRIEESSYEVLKSNGADFIIFPRGVNKKCPQYLIDPISYQDEIMDFNLDIRSTDIRNDPSTENY